MGWMTNTDNQALLNQLRSQKAGGAPVASAMQGTAPEASGKGGILAPDENIQDPSQQMQKGPVMKGPQVAPMGDELAGDVSAMGDKTMAPPMKGAPMGALDSLFSEAPPTPPGLPGLPSPEQALRPLDPRRAKQNLQNLGGVLRPSNLIHPKQGLAALGRFFGRG